MTDDRPALAASERRALEEKLRQRQRELRAEIASRMNNQDDPAVVGMRNRLEETDDWAMADAMANMDIASVSHDMAELATVESALARLRDGDYGECTDCGVAIPIARLVAYPAATRCVSCQEVAEAAARRAGPPR